jgi:hypothetical protein
MLSWVWVLSQPEAVHPAAHPDPSDQLLPLSIVIATALAVAGSTMATVNAAETNRLDKRILSPPLFIIVG